MIAILLRDWRTMNRLTLAQAADLFGVLPGVISRLENGKSIEAATMLHIINRLFLVKGEGNADQD